MKIFVLVIAIAIVIGGFIGGEVSNQTFTILGAALGGVGTFAVLMGLGALFAHLEQKKDKAANLTPEMRAVFARMVKRQAGKAPLPKSKQSSALPSGRFSIEGAVQSLIEQDLETLAAGKIPERRLIPHHAIKRDIIIKAFEVDFERLSPSMQDLNRDHFQSQLDGIRRLDQHELDQIIVKMKEQRTDLVELERQIRERHPLYSMVDPLF